MWVNGVIKSVVFPSPVNYRKILQIAYRILLHMLMRTYYSCLVQAFPRPCPVGGRLVWWTVEVGG
jgi:hypothetical protein